MFMLRGRAGFDGIYMALGSEHIPNTLKYASLSLSYAIQCVYLKRMEP